MITPADNAAREHVDDERHVQPALPGRDLSEVRYPELVRPIGRELAVDPVQWSGDGHIGDRRANALAAHRPTQALQLHQPANRAARYCNSFSNHDAVQHDAGSLMGRSAGLCSAARPRTYRDGDRQRSSEFESAVELRLGEKSAGNLQDFISPTQFLDLSLQRL